MSDLLDDTRKEIEKRLRELRPLVDEYRRLESAAAALADAAGSAIAAVASMRRSPGRPHGSAKAAKAASSTTATASASAKKRGRPPGRKKAGRRPSSTAATSTASAGRRPGRRKGSGNRSAQALRLVKGQPGITIPELATKMGIKQNYLYRVLPALEREGKVRKQGKGWHPA
jgi:hypothetical protein